MATTFRGMLEDYAEGRSSLETFIDDLAHKIVLGGMIKDTLGMAGGDEAIAKKLMGALATVIDELETINHKDDEGIKAFRKHMSEALKPVLGEAARMHMRNFFTQGD